MRLMAFVTVPDPIRAHRGEPTAAPPLAPRARAPPAIELAPLDTFAFDQTPYWDRTAAPEDLQCEFEPCELYS